jgi:hypothetical protein
MVHGSRPTQSMVHGSRPTQSMVHGSRPTQSMVHGSRPTQSMVHGSRPTQSMVHGSRPTQSMVHGSRPTQSMVHGSHPTRFWNNSQYVTRLSWRRQVRQWYRLQRWKAGASPVAGRLSAFPLRVRNWTSAWDLRWTKWHGKCFRFPLSVLFHHCPYPSFTCPRHYVQCQ